MRRFNLFILSTFLGSLAFLGCGDDHVETRHETKVEGKSFLLSADDFDLETVMALMREDKVQSAEELEKRINDGGGISNVDVDGDGKVDYIQVKESRSGDALLLDFLAIPSSTQDEQAAETVATVRFSKNSTSNEVQVEGGYPSHVRGHHDHHYSYHHGHGLSMGEALFLTWLFMPSRPLFYHPYAMGYYTPRPVYPASALQSRRTQYRSSMKVSPVQRSTPSAGFKAASSTRKPSKFASPAKSGTGTGLSSKTGAAKAFETRDAAKPKSAATGFGASKSAAPSASTGSKPSSGSAWGASSGSTKSSSNPWGGKSGASAPSGSSSKTSGFGGSTGKKSSFGSSSGSKSSFGGSSSTRSRPSSRSSGGRRR